jgi:hypothetical protein
VGVPHVRAATDQAVGVGMGVGVARRGEAGKQAGERTDGRDGSGFVTQST